MMEPVLWYFADPMCSWCWGFSPVIEAIREEYRPRLKIALVLGGLRPGTTELITPSTRDEILHHWHQVQERSGQPFRFDGAMPDGFVYDTEPPSRAVLTMGSIDQEQIFPMLKAIQFAFYAQGQDVTQTEALVDLAAGFGIERETFLHAFESEELRAMTLAHFKHARQVGVRGFPTLILQQGNDLHLVTNGWQPLADIRSILNSHLGQTP